MEVCPLQGIPPLKKKRASFVSYIRNLVCTLLKLVFRLKFVTRQIVYAVDIYVSTFCITAVSTYV